MQTASTTSSDSFSLFLLKVAACSGLVATVVPAVAIEFFATLDNRAWPSPLHFLATVLLLCPITAVSCGLFGAVAGILGGSVLYLRRIRIRSVKRLLLESGVAGLVFGLLYLPVDAAANSPSLKSFRPSMDPRQMTLTLPLAILCAVICALFFRKRFVQ
jgi:nitrate reductase gamma subunit